MATPYTVQLPGGGSITVNASSPEAARQNAGVGDNAQVYSGGHQTVQNSSGQTVQNPQAYQGAGESPNMPGAPPKPGGSSAVQDEAYARSVAAWQKMLEAQAQGNLDAFNEAKNEFNQNYALSQAGVTGMYNGNPTEAARQFNVGAQQTALRDQANLGTSLLNAATNIRGPKDYLQYQQYTHGGQNLMQQLYGNQPIPQGAAPTGQLQSANLSTVLNDIGWSPGQGQQQQQAPNADMQALLSRFGLTPQQAQSGQGLNPWQIDPARWDQLGQVGQDLTKNLAETNFGYDPTDFVNQINSTRPQGQSLRGTALSYAQPRGLY